MSSPPPPPLPRHHHPLARKPKPPTLTSRMATAEEKLDALAAQMKSMLLLMETFNRWRPKVDHFSTKLSKDIKNLTSRIEALEAQPHAAPPSAPPREEEGRAKGHDIASITQGSDKGALVLQQPLANDISWAELCIAVESKFGKDLYHNAMNDLLQIKQTADVQEYYESMIGFKVSVLESQPKSLFKKTGRDFNRHQGKQLVNTQPGILGNPQTKDTKPKWDDKLATLRAQRRAQGLCMKCGEKWGRNHKCPEKVALHVLEQLQETFYLTRL
ncbi:unnamed protein product [Miscanthus lutarioriparius]|uniref:Retrotransposon gag domain-containing protein n=1 Tax=Miscanthus lutarioriparius TaxID=422564 RepID=A0A811QPA5_9POAL|nr:unnamed protein product [Miscanthus lutarioriparius]